MDVISAIRNRRKYTVFLQKEVPDDTLRLIAEMAHSAPTGASRDSREFVLVKDRDLLDNLGKTHGFCAWLSGTAAAVVILGNPEKSKYWLEDSSIAAEHIWLAATGLGLGASWAAVYQSDNFPESQRREDYVRALLNIPSSLRPLAIIGLGFPAENQPPRSKSTKRQLEEVLHLNRYGEPWSGKSIN